MSDVVEMAEAHLLNVQREIQQIDQEVQNLKERKEQLTSYLNDGVQELQTVKSQHEVLAGSDDTSSQTTIT